MKNNFKDYFGLNKNFEGQKIFNDFEMMKKFNQNKLKTTVILSFSSFLILKFGFYLINNHKELKSNLTFRWVSKISTVKEIFIKDKNSITKLLFNFSTLRKVLK